MLRPAAFYTASASRMSPASTPSSGPPSLPRGTGFWSVLRVWTASLSTTGALCLAGVPAGVDSHGLFNKLLAWGLSMTVVGALVCWLMFG